ncbi:hypothetical protein M6B38_380695 [Iris pallida]|uniref:Uncharacterized protein n=1 Tax=Iris pallida TaxID=29817 RepID=A0AAX6G9B8_IRIPA|nr:hypothetical protein M6B38_380695 [Iris pallida]
MEKNLENENSRTALHACATVQAYVQVPLCVQQSNNEWVTTMKREDYRHSRSE